MRLFSKQNVIAEKMSPWRNARCFQARQNTLNKLGLSEGKSLVKNDCSDWKRVNHSYLWMWSPWNGPFRIYFFSCLALTIQFFLLIYYSEKHLSDSLPQYPCVWDNKVKNTKIDSQWQFMIPWCDGDAWTTHTKNPKEVKINLGKVILACHHSKSSFPLFSPSHLPLLRINDRERLRTR